jgi:cytochrome b subunit of formate dehydrogenase
LLIDRLLHWATAASVVILLATAFLPILGIEFAWVTLHWATGIVLAATVSIHIVRALFWQDLRSMWIGVRDLRDGVQLAKWALRRSHIPPVLAGKYSLAQKTIHHAFAAVVLTTVVTGGLMLVKTLTGSG